MGYALLVLLFVMVAAMASAAPFFLYAGKPSNPSSGSSGAGGSGNDCTMPATLPCGFP